MPETPDTTEITVQIGTVAFSFNIDYNSALLEILARLDWVQRDIALAIHGTLQSDTETLFTDIEKCPVRYHGKNVNPRQDDI